MSQHHHHHSHEPPNYNRAFVIGIALNVGFVVVEAVFGFLTNSLALLADAGHNLSDVLGLLLAWGASWLVRRRPTQRYTYGLRRSSILAALLNASVLLVAMGAIATEAIRRFSTPQPVSGGTMLGVALVGIVINGVTAVMFMSGRERDLNIKGAFLHMAADALVSFGVVLAGIAILTTGWLWFDPVISLIIVVVIVVGTWNLLRDSLDLALDAVPQGIEPQAVQIYLDQLPGVVEVHDLHIWAMSTTETALTAHLVMLTGNPGDAFLSRISMELHDKFGIEHTTIQVETGNFLLPCAQKSCCD
jgi:cobalt-zinc-cadmium efflux system protein